MFELLALLTFIAVTAALFALAVWWAEQDDDEEDR